MTHNEFKKGLPIITMTGEKQVAKVDNLVVDPEPGDFRAGLLTGTAIGLLIGGLAGAVAMLLLAPQSGNRTRAKLNRQSHELREQAADAVEAVEDAVAQARDKAHQVTHDVRKQAEDLEQRGQAMLDGQMDNLATIVEAGKNAVQGNRG
jgi:gas vesicle protein